MTPTRRTMLRASAAAPALAMLPAVAAPSIEADPAVTAWRRVDAADTVAEAIPDDEAREGERGAAYDRQWAALGDLADAEAATVAGVLAKVMGVLDVFGDALPARNRLDFGAYQAMDETRDDLAGRSLRGLYRAAHALAKAEGLPLAAEIEARANGGVS
ncbi:MAG: hypothetical protein ACFBWO_07720 [Paracoccaceae bacterium]